MLSMFAFVCVLWRCMLFLNRYLCNVLGTREVVGDDTSSDVAISMPPRAIMLSHELQLPGFGRYTSIHVNPPLRNDIHMIFIWYSNIIHSCLRYVFKHWVKDTFPFLLLERVFECLRVGICHNLLNLLLFQDPLGKCMRSGQTCYGKLLLKSWLTLWPWLFYHFQSPVYKNSLEVSDLCICSETYSGSSKLAGNEYMRIYICIYIFNII